MLRETTRYPPDVLAEIVVDALKNLQAEFTFDVLTELKDDPLKQYC